MAVPIVEQHLIVSFKKQKLLFGTKCSLDILKFLVHIMKTTNKEKMYVGIYKDN